MTFTITGASGVWAEAETERAAVEAARTFVEQDGEEYATVDDQNGRRVGLGEIADLWPFTFIYRTAQGRRI